MKAKLNSPEQNHASNGARRIRRISQYLRAIVLIYLVVLPGYAMICILAAHRGGSTNWYWGPSGAGVSLAERWMAGISGMIYLGMAVIFYRLLNLVERSRILVVASHSSKLITELCNKAIWLHQGSLIAYGPVEEVLAAYGSGEVPVVSEAAS